MRRYCCIIGVCRLASSPVVMCDGRWFDPGRRGGTSRLRG
jgi:hypothetical protein